MRLSVVIPAKNEEKLLPKLLASIRWQTFQDLEIIMADAGSTDRTRQIAASFGARIVSGGMPGPGRNRGACVATGEYIAFFDADVFLQDEDFLYDVMEEICERDADVATCRLRADAGTRMDDAMHEAYNAFTLATERFLPHAPGFCLFAKKSAHESINGFDEDVVFAEDHDYVRRAVKRGFKFAILRRQKISVSVRRLEKEGRAMLAAKYIYGELAMLTRGPFKHRMPFAYDFDHRAAKNTDQ